MAASVSDLSSTARYLLLLDLDRLALQSASNDDEKNPGGRKAGSSVPITDSNHVVDSIAAESSEDSDSEAESAQQPQHITERRQIQNARFSAW